MGGRGARSNIGQAHTGITMTGTVTGASNISYGVFDDTDAQKLRDDMEDIYDPDVTDAIKLYISDSKLEIRKEINYGLQNERRP